MFAFVAVMLSQDWSAFEGRRELTADEMGEVRRHLVAWTEYVPVPELRAVGRMLEVVHAERLPHVRIEGVCMTEERRVEEAVTSYPREGLLPRRRVTEVEPWEVAVPAPSPEQRFTSHERRAVVAGSAEVRSCVTCGGTGVAACATCAGRAKPCAACAGKGTVQCYGCLGRRKGTCKLCNGSKRTGCFACMGRGTRVCATCMGHGTSTCGACRGTCRVVAQLEVVVAATAHRRERVVTDAGSWWSPLVKFGDAWTAEAEGDAIGPAVNRVRGESIRREMLGSLASVDEPSARRLRAQRVTVTLVAYRWEGRDYQVALTDGGIVALESPMTRWAAARVAEGDAAVVRHEWREADAAYRRALAVDPTSMPARRGLAEVARGLSPTWQTATLWVLVPTAAAIALAMGGLKLYVRRRRARAV
jgi:hypothetical protein